MIDDDRKTNRDSSDDEPEGKKSPNIAPDAVKDPSAKTDGKPGAASEGNEADPGGG